MGPYRYIMNGHPLFTNRVTLQNNKTQRSTNLKVSGVYVGWPFIWTKLLGVSGFCTLTMDKQFFVQSMDKLLSVDYYRTLFGCPLVHSGWSADKLLSVDHYRTPFWCLLEHRGWSTDKLLSVDHYRTSFWCLLEHRGWSVDKLLSVDTYRTSFWFLLEHQGWSADKVLSHIDKVWVFLLLFIRHQLFLASF